MLFGCVLHAGLFSLEVLGEPSLQFFPVFSRSPARCFACALRELRGSAFPVPSATNLPRNARAAMAKDGRNFLRTLPEKRPLPLGAGPLASLRA